MLGRQAALELLEKALSLSQADQTEVLLESEHSQLTRYANSAIHQNLAEANLKLAVRAVVGKRIGSASTNQTDPASLGQVVENAVSLARRQRENPDFVSLPGRFAQPPAVDTLFDATAASTPEDRAAAVERMVALAARQGCSLSGSFSAGAAELAVANSLGIRSYQPLTSAELIVVADRDGASGRTEWTSRNLAELDLEGQAAMAVDKAVRSQHPLALEPGDYPVILEPAAVAEMLDFLAWMGLGATSLQEGRSFMTDRLGEKLVSEQITLWDDGLDPAGIPLPFDFEGVPKQRVTMFERGVARGVVYDSYTAYKQGKESTGHGLPAPNPFGPLPTNMFLAGGEPSLDQIIAGSQRAVLITRFHYVNIVHPKETVVTGMTRDGTFLVEDGRVTRPVKNLRFTQSILEALSAVEAVGKETRRFAYATVPALKIGRFKFTS